MSINGEPGENEPLLENSDSSPSINRLSDQGERRRQPVHFTSLRSYSNYDGDSTTAVLHRYRYYGRLAPHSDSTFQMPDHVVPPDFYIVVPMASKGKQSSIITIFSMWNTMMGTSILSMPWAIRQAGFATGITLLILMAVLMFYTSYRILKSMQLAGKVESGLDFSDVCRLTLGRWAQILAVVSSLLTLMGGAIVYWILMSNFLYNVVNFIYHHTTSAHEIVSNTTSYVCPSMSPPSHSGNHSNHSWLSSSVDQWLLSDHSHEQTYDKVWNEQYTVPFFLVIVLGPIVNFKSPTFFTKFNALGTLSVMYLVSFVAVNAHNWGFNLTFGGEEISGDPHQIYIPEFRGTFVALTGVAALAYFLQNCVISICRNQQHPENNIRDLSIAYILVAVTYIYMGVMFYSSFPLNKDCIEDNLLNNIADTDILAFVARIGLFFQMVCVFPLLLYIFRAQLLFSLFGDVWPSVKHVLVLNLCLVAVCVVFAVFLPHIGSIIGFVGAFCGFSYAILLPCLVHMKTLHERGELSAPVIVIHSLLIVLGLANFIGQFLIIGKT